MRLFAAFHRRAEYLPHGPVIDLASRARLSPPWVLGVGPVTHAFVVVECGDGARFRLDGEPPSSRLRVYRSAPSGVEAAWHIPVDGHEDAVMDAIERNTGVPYDPVEVFTQLLPGLGRVVGVPGANICTALMLNVLSVLDVCKPLASHLSTLYPEAAAQALRRMERDSVVTRAW